MATHARVYIALISCLSCRLQQSIFCFFFFFFCTKIPVLIILVTEKKLKLPICMPLRKDDINQFVGTYIWHIYIWHIYIWGENINQRPIQLQGAHLSPPLPRRRKGTASLSAELGRQESWLWAKWDGGGGVRSTEEETGMALEQQAL